jgi:hypothetical protein
VSDCGVRGFHGFIDFLSWNINGDFLPAWAGFFDFHCVGHGVLPWDDTNLLVVWVRAGLLSSRLRTPASRLDPAERYSRTESVVPDRLRMAITCV